MLVEKLLWMSPVTIPQMHWIELVLTVAFNAGLWWSIASAWRVIRARPICPGFVLRALSPIRAIRSSPAAPPILPTMLLET